MIKNSHNTNYNNNTGNSTMKTLGIIMMVIGLGIALYTGFNSVTSDQVADVRNVELRDNRDNNANYNRENDANYGRDNDTNWGPFAGIGLMIIGGVVYFAGRKKVLTHDGNLDNTNRNNLDNPNRNLDNPNRNSDNPNRNSDNRSI